MPSALSGYFVICVLGFITREDNYGVSTFVRSIGLPKRCYNSLLSFYHNQSVKLGVLERKWWHIVDTMLFPFTVNGYIVLIADGSKVQKEGKRMPSVKKLGQTSVDQTKPSYIWGTMFQSISMLCAASDCMVATPLTMPIVDGVAATAEWEDSPYIKETQVVRMAKDSCKIALELNKPSLVLGDRYYMSRSVLEIIVNHSKNNPNAPVHIITKAKKNYSGYLPLTAEEKKDKRRKKGEKVKIFSYFDDVNTIFEEKVVYLYGKEHNVKIAAKELLWGYGIYVPMLFVFVEYWDDEKDITRREVLASSDTSLSAEQIMQLYSYRFKIEVQFKSMKNSLGTFTYRFWSKSQPVLSKKRKKGDPDPLDLVKDSRERRNILSTLRATELYVFTAMVAQGITQAIALRFPSEGNRKKLRFQVTEAAAVPSEENVMYIIRKYIGIHISKEPHSYISLQISKVINRANWADIRKARKTAG